MRMWNWVAATAATACVSFVGAQPPKADPVKPAGGVAKAEVVKPGQALTNMLAEARAALAKTRDYTGTYTRQERIAGKLGAEQVAEMKVRVNPVAVSVRFVRPESAAGMQVVYSEGKRDGKVHFRTAGVAGRKGLQALALDDSKFLDHNRHKVTDWGMGPIIELISTSTAREKTLNNPVEVHTADYQFAGKNVTKFDIRMRRPHAFRYAAHMVVFVDKETKLPVRFEAYTDPKPGTTAGELLEAYSFTDLKFNTGLGENAFDY